VGVWYVPVRSEEELWPALTDVLVVLEWVDLFSRVGAALSNWVAVSWC
jgi:hypothetical protein